jgi:MFS family permease
VPNAIALNSSMVNGSRIVGPAIGGLIIAAVGEGWCFAIDALSYVAVIVSILAMRFTPHVENHLPVAMLREIRSAWRYVTGSLPIRSALLLLAIVSIAGVPYTVLMPAIAAQELGGGPNTMGVLMGASGVGALLGGLYLASRSTVVGLGRIMLIGALTFGVALVLFSFARAMWVAAPLLAIAGAGFIIQMASTNTVIQTIVDERFRGRVMAFYTMAFFGAVPIGSLLSGIAAERVGAPMTIRLGGVVCIASGLWFALRLPLLRTLVRPIYIERGIIVEPPVDAGTTP